MPRSFGHAPRVTVPKPEPKSPSPGESVELGRLEAEQAEAEALRDKLRAVVDGDCGQRCALALAEARVWDIRADIRYTEGNDDGAKKASSNGGVHREAARKLAESHALDRLAELENELADYPRRAQAINNME